METIYKIGKSYKKTDETGKYNPGNEVIPVNQGHEILPVNQNHAENTGAMCLETAQNANNTNENMLKTPNLLSKSYKKKKPKAKKSPELIKQLTIVEHNIDSIKFLNEDKKTLLRKQCIEVVRKQYLTFIAPESNEAKAWSHIQYKRIFDELRENNFMIINNVFK